MKRLRMNNLLKEVILLQNIEKEKTTLLRLKRLVPHLMIVVFALALIVPAVVTLINLPGARANIICEHVHDESCYEYVCGHSHGPECYETTGGHSHSDDCYTTETHTHNAGCYEVIPGHVHTEGCDADCEISTEDTTGGLTCTIPESARILICGLEEDSGGEHVLSCNLEEIDYVQTLTCEHYKCTTGGTCHFANSATPAGTHITFDTLYIPMEDLHSETDINALLLRGVTAYDENGNDISYLVYVINDGGFRKYFDDGGFINFTPPSGDSMGFGFAPMGIGLGDDFGFILDTPGFGMGGMGGFGGGSAGYAFEGKVTYGVLCPQNNNEVTSSQRDVKVEFMGIVGSLAIGDVREYYGVSTPDELRDAIYGGYNRIYLDGVISFSDGAHWFFEEIYEPVEIISDGQERHFHITNGTQVAIGLGIILNGNDYGGGVIILGHDSKLDINGGSIINCSADKGGAVYATDYAEVTIYSGMISQNRSNEYGDGGGLFIEENASLTMIGGYISDNETGQNGGGIAIDNATFEMSGGIIDNNRTNGSGGGIYATNLATVDIYDGEIYSNTANYFGGGIDIGNYSTATIQGGRIIRNHSNSNGGGISVRSTSTASMFYAYIDRNTAGEDGGGIFITDYGTNFWLYGGVIDGNGAKSGGGISIIYEAVLYYSGGEIKDNRADFKGGGVDAGIAGTIEITGGSIFGNSAEDGGGIHLSEGSNSNFGFRDVWITGNTASNNGGGIMVDSYINLELANITISGNSAGNRGGGIAFVKEDQEYTINGGQIINNWTFNTDNDPTTGLGGGIYIGYKEDSTEYSWYDRFNATLTIKSESSSVSIRENGISESGTVMTKNGGGIYSHGAFLFLIKSSYYYEISSNAVRTMPGDNYVFGNGGAIWLWNEDYIYLHITDFSGGSDDTIIFENNIASRAYTSIGFPGSNVQLDITPSQSPCPDTEFENIFNNFDVVYTAGDPFWVGESIPVDHDGPITVFGVDTYDGLQNLLGTSGIDEESFSSVEGLGGVSGMNTDLATREALRNAIDNKVPVTLEISAQFQFASEGLVIRSGTDITIVADSTDRTLWMPDVDSGRHFTVEGDAIFTIGNGITLTTTNSGHNITGGGVKVLDSPTGGIFNLNGGIIRGNYQNAGGGVQIGANGTFNMTGGEITENISLFSGGGVQIDGPNSTFNMSGGEITGNRVGAAQDLGGGGVFARNSSVNITGGEINFNIVNDAGYGFDHGGGGGIFADNAELRIVSTDGMVTINNNMTQASLPRISNGGAINVSGNSTVLIDGRSNGIIIRGNSAEGVGGGINITGIQPDKNAFSMTGNVQILFNAAALSGGGIFLWMDTIEDIDEYVLIGADVVFKDNWSELAVDYLAASGKITFPDINWYGENSREGTASPPGNGFHLINGWDIGCLIDDLGEPDEPIIVDYKVTFNFNYHGAPVSVTRTVPPGGTVGDTVPGMPGNPVRAGHTFDGWNTRNVGLGSTFHGGTAVNSDITVFAQWIPQISITFVKNINETDDLADPYHSVLVDAGLPIGVANMPVRPTRDGFRFDGWHERSDGFGDGWITAAYEPAGRGIVAYAQWTPVYTIIFSSNHSDTDGFYAAFPQTISNVAEGEVLNALPGSPIRKGHAFAGWNTNPSGTGIHFDGGTAVEANRDVFIISEDGRTITVFAMWQESFTVTFDKNHNDTGGWSAPDNNANTIGVLNGHSIGDDSFAAMQSRFTRNWHTFDVRFDEENENTPYSWVDENGRPFTADTVVGQDMKVFALWLADTPVTVRFHSNHNDLLPGSFTHAIPFGASLPGTNLLSILVQNGTSIGVQMPMVPTRAGFHFTGWSTLPVGTEETTVTAETLITSDVTPPADVILYAQWVRGITVRLELAPRSAVDGKLDRAPHNNIVSNAVPERLSYPFNLDAKIGSNPQSPFACTHYVNGTGGCSGPIGHPIGSSPLGSHFCFLRSHRSNDFQNPFIRGEFLLGWKTSSSGNATPTVSGETTLRQLQENRGERVIFASWEQANILEFKMNIPCTSTCGCTGVNRVTAYSFDGCKAETWTRSIPQETYIRKLSRIGGDGVPHTNPTWLGHYFIGWSASPNGGGALINHDYVSSITGNQSGLETFYAVWQVLTQYINYDMNGGRNHPSNPHTFTGRSHFPINIQEPLPRHGYEFLGWEIRSSTRGLLHSSTKVFNIPGFVEEDFTLKALWSDPLVWTITYIMNGGANPADNPGSYTYKDLPVGILNPPVRPGYIFLGWDVVYEEWAQGNSISPRRNYVLPANAQGNLTLTARWSEIPYQIRYDLNDMDGTTAAVNHSSNPFSYVASDLVAPRGPLVILQPSREGYSFTGWTIEFLTDGEVIGTVTDKNITYTIPAGIEYDIIFTAHWDAISVNVTFDVNTADVGVTVDPASKEVTFDKQYREPHPYVWPKDPVRTGHDFLGWWTTPETGGERITDTSIVRIPDDHTLYARWTLTTYEIRYDPNGGLAANGEPAQGRVVPETYGSEHTVLPQISTSIGIKPYHQFIGWNTDPLGNGTSYAPGEKFNVDNNKTLYAQWILDISVNYRIISLDPGTTDYQVSWFGALRRSAPDTYLAVEPADPYDPSGSGGYPQYYQAVRWYYQPGFTATSAPEDFDFTTATLWNFATPVTGDIVLVAFDNVVWSDNGAPYNGSAHRTINHGVSLHPGQTPFRHILVRNAVTLNSPLNITTARDVDYHSLPPVGLGNNEARLITISVDNDHRHFDIRGGGKVNLKFVDSLIMLSGRGAENGGGINISGAGTNVTLINATIQGCRNANGGAAAIGSDSILTMESGMLRNNIATNGGGIYNNGTLNLRGTELSYARLSANRATYGGGVYNAGTFNLQGSALIANNRAANGGTTADGGGVYNNGSFIMSGGIVNGNLSARGGGVFNNSGTFTFSGGVIEENGHIITIEAGSGGNNAVHEISKSGGGIFNNSTGTLEITGAAVLRENSAENGGGVYNTGMFTMNNGLIESNIAVNNTVNDHNTDENTWIWAHGGGVYNSGSFMMTGAAKIEMNTAEKGGGVFNSSINGVGFIVTGGFIDDNSATYGGGINNTGMMSIANGSILRNRSGFGDGGGIYHDTNRALVISNTEIRNNTARNGNGGGIWIAYENLDSLKVDAGSGFSSNVAFLDFMRMPVDDAMYARNILVPATEWSDLPPSNTQEQGYNNFDIAYTKVLVTFDENDGVWTDTEENRTRVVEFDTLIGAPPSEPTRVGYRFIEWNTEEDGSGRDLTALCRAASNRSITFYAQWELMTDLTVTFDANAGTDEVTNMPDPNPVTDVTAFTTISEPADEPLRPVYTFLGWYKDEEGTEPWNFTTDEVTESIILYAKWERVPQSFTAPDRIDYGTDVIPLRETVYGLRGTNPAHAKINDDATDIMAINNQADLGNRVMEPFVLTGRKMNEWSRIDLTYTPFMANGRVGARPLPVNNITGAWALTPGGDGNNTIQGVYTPERFLDGFREATTDGSIVWYWEHLIWDIKSHVLPGQQQADAKYQTILTWEVINAP